MNLDVELNNSNGSDKDFKFLCKTSFSTPSWSFLQMYKKFQFLRIIGIQSLLADVITWFPLSKL